MPTEPYPPLARGLLIFGAGGHARVVADAALRAGITAVLASDRDPARCQGELLPGVTLRPLADLPQPWAEALHVAIGDNAARERETLALGAQQLTSLCHPAASVSVHAHLAPGCFVAAQAVVAPGARLGRGVIVNHGAVVDHDCHVGDFAHIAPGAVLGGGVRIGAAVLVGAGAVVQPGRSLAAGAVIGAGAVVCQDIDLPGTWVGVPARRTT